MEFLNSLRFRLSASLLPVSCPDIGPAICPDIFWVDDEDDVVVVCDEELLEEVIEWSLWEDVAFPMREDEFNTIFLCFSSSTNVKIVFFSFFSLSLLFFFLSLRYNFSRILYNIC